VPRKIGAQHGGADNGFAVVWPLTLWLKNECTEKAIRMRDHLSSLFGNHLRSFLGLLESLDFE